MNNDIPMYEYEIRIRDQDTGEVEFSEKRQTPFRSSVFWRHSAIKAAGFARKMLGEFEGYEHVEIIGPNGDSRTFKVTGWVTHKTTSREVRSLRTEQGEDR